jgi:predicted phosphodiesterase
MYAVISDIHGNLSALQAVLADIDAQGIEEILCLGDVVGYGPEPQPCVDLVRARCAVTVMGNHEEALVHGAYGFHLRAREAIDWTRDQLKPGFFSGSLVRARWDWACALPLRHERGPDLFVHGSPRQPTSEYLLSHELDQQLEKYQEVFDATDRLLFVGHTHLPGVITDAFEWLTPGQIDGTYDFAARPESKAVINVGSVGQPRDGDPQACYVVVEGTRVSWRRVTYDVEQTVARVALVPRIHPSLGKRLLLGR